MEKQEIETWVPAKYIRTDGTVLDFTGLYDVSNLGKVRSLNYNHTRKAREMVCHAKKAKDGSIMYQVILRKGNKRYTLKVHRIVLSSFKECEYFPGAVCDHIDARSETYCNNCLDNLHWATQQQNVSTERCKTLNIERQRNRPDQSKKVKVTFSDGSQQVFPSAKEVARVLDLPSRTVSFCIFKHKGYYKKRQLYFEYVN